MAADVRVGQVWRNCSTGLLVYVSRVVEGTVPDVLWNWRDDQENIDGRCYLETFRRRYRLVSEPKEDR